MSLNSKPSISENQEIKSQQQETSKSHIYACFEQPQTIDILKYLSMPAPNKLLFDSGMKNTEKSSLEEQRNNTLVKRVKQFRFKRIYNRDEKFKFAFSEEINFIIEKLFKGYSQSVFIYGTEETKKDKILIGESQNAGFILTTLAEMFEYCHEKEIQDEVTIKLSCSLFKDGKFSDPFNFREKQLTTNQMNNVKEYKNETKKQEQQLDSMLCDDLIEGKYLLGCPEVIIRNMRTALKIINLITKKIQERRDFKEQNTENIVLTIKLEIDKAFNRQSGEVYEYSIPKLYIVKLGNPSINSTLNGVNKNNQWFVNMFNFLQSQALQDKVSNKKSAQSNKLQEPIKELTEFLNKNGVSTSENGKILSFQEGNDSFTDYIKTVVMNGVSDIHCFTSITNKMTSNQCLTAFIFNNYLSAYQTKPIKTSLNVQDMMNQKINYEDQLLNLFTVIEAENNQEKEISEKYRVKFNLKTENSSLGLKMYQYTSNSRVEQKQRSKHKGIISSTLQKDSNTKSLKKMIQGPQSSLLSNQAIEPQSQKQTLRSILSFSGAESQDQIQEKKWQIKLYLLSYIESVREFMNCCNLVQYEYAQILSQGCQKLTKYIFNEEIEDFFYAKKTSLQYSLELKLSLQALRTQKLKNRDIQDKIMKKIRTYIKKVNFQLEILKKINNRHEYEDIFKVKRNKLLTLIKERDIATKIFEYYNTMSFHFIYEDNIKLIEELKKTKIQIDKELQRKNYMQNVVNYEQIMTNIKKGFNNRINEKRNVSQIDSKNEGLDQNDKQVQKAIFKQEKTEQSQPFTQKQASHNRMDKLKEITQKVNQYKMKKKQDQLDKMFTNTNIGQVRSQFQKKKQK